MVNVISLIKIMLENDIVKTALVYYLVGSILWLLYGFIAYRLDSKPIYRTFSTGSHKLLCSLAIMLVFTVMMEALNYVGFLPYGPDTAGYTRAVKTISMTGHWFASGYDPYYAPYHTSACFLTIVTEILGSLQVAYSTLLVAFLLSLLLILGRWISKIAGASTGCIGIAIVALLFIASPKLMGFDLLQQYVSLVYATACVIILLAHPKSVGTYLTFSLFAVISIITHLSSILLVSIPLAALLFFRKRELAIGSFLFLTIGSAYLFSYKYITAAIPHAATATSTSTAAIPHAATATSLVKKLLYGSPSEFVIRALNEVPYAKIALFSWTLLPSIASAYIILLLFLLFRAKVDKKHKTFKHNIQSLIPISEMSFNGFILASFIVALGYLFLGLLTKAIGVDLFRYAAVPSYFILLVAVSALIIRIFTKNKVLMVLFLLLLTPYLYSAMYSSERAPWMGGSRLAPVTYADRLELMPVAVFASDNVRIYSWHDAYVPIEYSYSNATLKTGGSYYPIHALLLQVASGKDVTRVTKEISLTPYFILPRYIIRSKAYKSYNLIYIGKEHVLFTIKG